MSFGTPFVRPQSPNLNRSTTAGSSLSRVRDFFEKENTASVAPGTTGEASPSAYGPSAENENRGFPRPASPKNPASTRQAWPSNVNSRVMNAPGPRLSPFGLFQAPASWPARTGRPIAVRIPRGYVAISLTGPPVAPPTFAGATMTVAPA